MGSAGHEKTVSPLPGMLPTPDVQITDAGVDATLAAAVAIINPLLDVLWGTDPLGLKRRDDGVGWALNAADLPGTPAWDDMDADARIHWWVWRVGALNTVAVAFPGVLGILARRLPIQDLLGFVSQAIVLCAVARELGVTDQRPQVRMLAAVLCDRDLSVVVYQPSTDRRLVDIPHHPLGIVSAVWNLVGLFDAIGDEVGKRPQPRAPFRYLGLLPAVGAVAAYFGECGALARAAKMGRRWIERQSQT
ncbi:hypothetical protein [Mycolicibacterium austroafricanum]|uniref:hypothetical protein n=1 Tax=Mycolicibacterium austroafricanum TaxID=39687 RepID=UPI000AA0BBCB|nr:hypothetical protein [Mycolicibacterium austroafricanum]QZT57403.1 hypothetical protein JN084_01910 [Mycolicibacterium austroafricanum]QZY46700.1 hypothetical protein K5L12_02695 [Mycolicibacterium austroafricanum]